jgi:hypothetical protein
VAYYPNFSQGTEDKHSKPKSVGQSRIRDLNVGPPKYEGEFLSLLIATSGLCFLLAAKPKGAGPCDNLPFLTTH